MTKNEHAFDRLLAQGFDNSTLNRGVIHVHCSQCQAICINGMATHEHGCPHAKHECNGCNELIPARHVKDDAKYGSGN